MSDRSTPSGKRLKRAFVTGLSTTIEPRRRQPVVTITTRRPRRLTLYTDETVLMPEFDTGTMHGQRLSVADDRWCFLRFSTGQ